MSDNDKRALLVSGQTRSLEMHIESKTFERLGLWVGVIVFKMNVYSILYVNALDVFIPFATTYLCLS